MIGENVEFSNQAEGKVGGEDACVRSSLEVFLVHAVTKRSIRLRKEEMWRMNILHNTSVEVSTSPSLRRLGLEVLSRPWTMDHGSMKLENEEIKVRDTYSTLVLKTLPSLPRLDHP